MVAARPMRSVMASPLRRKMAMAAEKTAYPTGASPAPAPSTCFRYTPVQSAIAPSERKMQKPMALSAKSATGSLRRLNNVVKHAKARTVTVELTKSDAQLLLWVRDDGVGFDVASMREQA